MDITRSQIDAQQAVVDKLHNGTRAEDLRSAEAKVKEARAEKDFLASDYQRKQDAFEASGGKSVSRQVLEDARTKLNVAEAKVNEAGKRRIWRWQVPGVKMWLPGKPSWMHCRVR